MLLNAIKNVLCVDFMDELRKILIILSLWEILHIFRGFLPLHSCRGQTSRGEPELPGLAGGAYSVPPYPHTELSTPNPFPNLETFTEKVGCGEAGKHSFLPGPQNSQPSGLQESVAPHPGRGLRKGMVGTPGPPAGFPQTNSHPFSR